jgi:hypothetical protein
LIFVVEIKGSYLKFNPSKCEYAINNIGFLGQNVNKEGTKLDQSYILKQLWWCLSVRPSVLQGRAGQGSQTFSVTLRITDFWPRSGFGNFDLLLLLAAAISKDHWPKVTGTHGGLHSGLQPQAPTSKKLRE